MRNVTEYGQGTDIPFDPDAVGVYHQTLSSMQVVDEEVRVTWHGSMCDRISSFEAVERDGRLEITVQIGREAGNEGCNKRLYLNQAAWALGEVAADLEVVDTNAQEVTD